MPILCYEASGTTEPNPLSSTEAQDGHVAAIIKSDHKEATAQIYSELAANRLAQFLGIPVLTGVPVRHPEKPERIQFAALKAAEHCLDLYDFTLDEDPDHPGDFVVTDGMYANSGHISATQRVCEKYPLETAQIAVFDLWIGNDDRPFNFKAELNAARGIFFALDQGASLLSCGSTIDRALELLETPDHPNYHAFQKLAHPVHCGGMVERIMNMPDWAIFAATTFDDTVGNVTLDEQFATAQLLIDRRGFLTDLVQRVLL